jgi:hypothetical protein
VALRPRAEDGEARLLVVDPRTLAVTATVPVDGREAVALAADEGGQLALLVDEDDRMLLYSAAAVRPEGQVLLTPFAVRQLELSSLYHHAGTDRWLAGAALRSGGVVVATDREAFGVARVFELPASSSVFGPSPVDPRLALASTWTPRPASRASDTSSPPARATCRGRCRSIGARSPRSSPTARWSGRSRGRPAWPGA